MGGEGSETDGGDTGDGLTGDGDSENNGDNSIPGDIITPEGGTPPDKEDNDGAEEEDNTPKYISEYYEEK